MQRWRNALLQIQNGRCFYDETHEMSTPEVDHVLPWSFVLEDKTWNLVVAYRTYNNVKRDRLADVGALERLCGRNEQILKGTIKRNQLFIVTLLNGIRETSQAMSGVYMIKLSQMAFPGGSDFAWWNSSPISIGQKPELAGKKRKCRFDLVSRCFNPASLPDLPHRTEEGSNVRVENVLDDIP